MTQQGMLLGAEVVGGEIERAARAHARASGLAFARVERARDLFGAPLEVGVTRRAFDGVQRHVQRQHAGRAKDDFEGPELGPDQRHARQLALTHEFPLRVHHHPGPVQVQPGFRQFHRIQFNAGA